MKGFLKINFKTKIIINYQLKRFCLAKERKVNTPNTLYIDSPTGHGYINRMDGQPID